MNFLLHIAKRWTELTAAVILIESFVAYRKRWTGLKAEVLGATCRFDEPFVAHLKKVDGTGCGIDDKNS